MHSPIHLNRRQWLTATGTALAGLALAPRLALRAAPAPSATTPDITGPVQLSLNENPFGPSARALAAMQRELPRVHRYPFNLTPE